MAFIASVDTLTATATIATTAAYWSHNESKLDQWIAAVNARPSNASKQIVKKRGYASATTNTYTGWIIELGHPSISDKIVCVHRLNGSATTILTGNGRTYVNDTSNGGMGSQTSINTASVSSSIGTSGGGEAFVLADDTEGQEIFCANWRTNSDAYQHYLYIFKTSQGNWAAISDIDGTRYTNAQVASYTSTTPVGYGYAISVPICIAASSNVTMIKQPVWGYNPASAAADPFASYDLIKPASTRLYACTDATPFRPIYRGDLTTLDIIQMVANFAFDITGIV